MLVIRPVVRDDLDDLLRLAKLAGRGLTSLPQDRGALAANIDIAVASFNRTNAQKDDYFLLVMEDTSKGQVVGTAGVHGRTGTRQAFYAYRIMPVVHYSHSLQRETRSELLHLTNDYTDCSEVSTLFLDPAYRGNGHWLSRSRYVLMALHPDRFATDVIAELRGWFDASGQSPFWQALGQKFFDMSFDEADQLCGVGSNQFITELMPKYPIYTNLLPTAAQQVMGKTHDATRRAMELLLEEGFVYENLIDIFDGGPLLRAKISRLRSVQSVVTLPSRKLSAAEVASPCLVSNLSLENLRIAFQPTAVAGEEAAVENETLSALSTKPGDKLLVMPGADQ